MNVLKRVYHSAAALALLNVMAALAGAAYLWSGGRVDVEDVRRAWDALNEEDAAAGHPSASEDETPDQPGGPEKRRPGAGALGLVTLSPEQQRLADEIAWRNAERYRTQIEQRLKLVNAARLDVDRRREAFEQVMERERREREQRQEKETVAGYAKQVEVIAALSPKAALAQIMTMDNVDAAGVLFELSTRKVKKIMETAKDPAERAKLTEVMKLLADVKADGEARTNESK